MTEDEKHAALGAMLHRGIVEQRQYEAELAESALAALVERLEGELDNARAEIKELRARISYLERW